jgi:hypothetical protein
MAEPVFDKDAVLLAVSEWLRLIFLQACELTGIAMFCLSLIISASIFSADWSKAKIGVAQFSAEEAKAVASQYRDQVTLTLKEAEILRNQIELLNRKAKGKK